MHLRRILKFAKNTSRLFFRSKSDLFLLAYLVFLIATLCFVFFKVDYNRNVISGVILTGMIFSVAELFYSLDAIKKDSLRLKIDAETFQEKALLKMQGECNEAMNRFTKTFESIDATLYCEDFQPRMDLPEAEKAKILEMQEKRKQMFLESKEYQTKRSEEIKAGEKDTDRLVECLRANIRENELLMQREPFIANVLMFLGILVFLVLLGVNKEFVFSDKVNTAITIAVFIVLVLNYYIKQIYTNIVSKDIQSYKEHAQYYLSKSFLEENSKSRPPIVPHKLYPDKSKK